MTDSWWKDAPVANGAEDWWSAAPKADEKPKREQSYWAGLARSVLGQGTAFGLGDEITAGVRALGGESYDEALEDERAKIAQFRDENPMTALVGEVGGSVLTPGLGLLGGVIKPAATLGGKIMQGAKIGAGYGGAYGISSGEGGVGNRLESGVKGAVAGGALGGLVPVAGAVAGNAVQKARDIVTPAIVRKTRGIEDAADEVMTARLRASGETPTSLRQQIDDAGRSGTFYGGGKSASQTESPLGLVDLSPSMQKLGGSAARSSDDAMTRADAFLNTRQTGVPPRAAGGKAAAGDAGLVSRNPLAPMEKGAKPAGQFERVKDALTRAMTLEDKDFHKFGENAYRTEQSLVSKLKEEADKLYSEARGAAQNFNIQPVIRPVIERIASELDHAPIGEANIVRRALKQFTTGNGNVVTSLEAFDKAKRAVDGLVGRARTAGDKNAERLLTSIKNELIEAVDNISTQGIGEKYRAARNYYSSQMELQDAINLGRQAFKENSDVVADQFRNLNEGQKKLFRLGLIESFESNLGRRKRTNDVTQIFETPRVQELLRDVIPRTETATGRAKKGAVYADRPERFGDFIANEKQMVRTGNKVLGNSATAERMADDAKFTRQGLSQMITNLRSSGGLTGVVLEGVATGLNRIFGMRDDVAAVIARRLFTADPQQRDAVLRRLEQAYGKQKLPALLDMLSNVRLVGATGVAGQIGQASANEGPGLVGSQTGNYGPR